MLDYTCQLLPPNLSDKDVTELHCLDCNAVIWPRVDPGSSTSSKPCDWPDELHPESEQPECDWSADESIVASTNPVDWLKSTLSHRSSSAKESADWLPSVTWESLAILLVRCVGSQVGVNLLRGVTLPEGVLTRQFHQACIVSTVLEKSQR